MTQSYLEHPSEEALERFLLHHANEEELDYVESHLLACDRCVLRLEDLELQIAAAKLALSELARQPKRVTAREKYGWRNWFTVRTLSWAGAAPAFVVSLAVAPQFLSHQDAAYDVTLSANRGSDTVSIPSRAPLHLHLAAVDATDRPLSATIVDAAGTPVWEGKATAHADTADVNDPKQKEAGSYLLRLYAQADSDKKAELLREFAFEAK